MLLELLHEAGSQLLLRQNLTLALALWTFPDVVGIVCAAASAVGADDPPVVGDFEILAEVQLLQCNFDFELEVGSGLLAPSNSTCQFNYFKEP